MGKRLYGISYFKNYAINKHGECLSDTYVNCVTKLKFKCEKNHEWETKPYYMVSKSTWCPKCNQNAKDNINTFHEIAKEHNGECLSVEYINARTSLEFKCNKNHTWFAKPSDIKFSKSWCPKCAGSYRLTIDEMKEIGESRNGKCLSNIYHNGNTKLKWECNNGHQWLATPIMIKSGTWCPICRESKGEKFIADYLDNHNINYVREKTFDNCKGIRNKLPFDFYLPDHNMCIEFDGKQHFVPTNFYGCSDKLSLKSFNELKINDKIKNKFCQLNNIILIRISYVEKNIGSLLDDKLRQLKII